MEWDFETYEKCKELCREKCRSYEKVSKVEAYDLGVSYQSLFSYQCQMSTQLIKSSMGGMFKSIERIYRNHVRTGRSLLELSINEGFSPYNFALQLVKRKWASNFKVKFFMNNPNTAYPAIPEEEIDMLWECFVEDPFNSVIHNQIRASVGSQYEDMLNSNLASLNIPFETEEDLRRRGVPKTPDIRLSIPLGIRVEDVYRYRPSEAMGVCGGGEEVLPIHWIDSKACFGDKIAIKDNLKQFTSYVNRFGPGMVVFWMGGSCDISDLPTSVCIATRFPSSLILPDGRTISSQHPATLESCQENNQNDDNEEEEEEESKVIK